MVSVRTVRPREASQLRELRLRALADAPEAFASTHELESAFPESRWLELCATAARGGTRPETTVYVALDGVRWVGMVAGRWFDRDHGIAQLWGMWVAPDHRREGIGAMLVAALRGWAGDAGARFLRLGVIEPAAEATEFYARLGFVVTGETLPLARDQSRRATFMARPI